RRQSRFSRDWSSDVCSSDLSLRGPPRRPRTRFPAEGVMNDGGRLAPVAGAGDDTVSGFQAQLVQAARDRAGSWDAAAEVLAAPAERTVERLRSGEIATAWRLAARWLEADAGLFTAYLMSLDV